MRHSDRLLISSRYKLIVLRNPADDGGDGVLSWKESVHGQNVFINSWQMKITQFSYVRADPDCVLVVSEDSQCNKK